MYNGKDAVKGKPGRGRVFQAEETACAKALRQEGRLGEEVGEVQGNKAPSVLRGNSSGLYGARAWLRGQSAVVTGLVGADGG